MTSPLLVDVSPHQPAPNWALLARLGAPWHGAIIKATEGITYCPPWFATNWRAVRDVAGDRYGADWFRGAYHFLQFLVDGAKQADFYLRAIERAGGWGAGDLWPIVDVELGRPESSNTSASAQQIIDCTTAFAARVKEVTGRDVMLYGNGAFRDRRIVGDTAVAGELGCRWLWLPRYTATLPPLIYERAGWTAEELVLWQYAGDGHAQLDGYPAAPPGFGNCDVSALVHAGGVAWLRSQLWAERP